MFLDGYGIMAWPMRPNFDSLQQRDLTGEPHTKKSQATLLTSVNGSILNSMIGYGIGTSPEMKTIPK